MHTPASGWAPGPTTTHPRSHPAVPLGVTLTGTRGCRALPVSPMQMTEGEIAPFGSIRVPVIFTPLVPGTAHSRVKVVFQNQQCPTVSILLPGPRAPTLHLSRP